MDRFPGGVPEHPTGRFDADDGLLRLLPRSPRGEHPNGCGVELLDVSRWSCLVIFEGTTMFGPLSVMESRGGWVSTFILRLALVPFRARTRMRVCRIL